MAPIRCHLSYINRIESIGVLFLVVGLIVCVPRYRMFLKYKGRASGKIIKIETNGKTSRAIFEYSVGKRIYRQHTG